MKKGLIVTIILVAAPIIWLVFSLNSIKEKETAISGDYSAIEDSINNIADEYISSASNEGTTPTTSSNNSGDSLSARYGNPISKLIEGAKIAVDTAKVYTEPNDTDLAIGTLYKDTVVTVQDYPNGWSQVKSDNLAGWTQTSNVIKPDDNADTSLGITEPPQEQTNIGKSATITVSSTLNVRDKANGSVIDAIAGGTEVKIIGADDGEKWYQIQWGTKTGWITSDSQYVKIKN